LLGIVGAELNDEGTIRRTAFLAMGEIEEFIAVALLSFIKAEHLRREPPIKYRASNVAPSVSEIRPKGHTDPTLALIIGV